MVTLDFPGNVVFSARATDDRGGVRTTNLNTLLVTMPLHVLNLGGIQTNGAFKFCMLGEPGRDYEVLANKNLTTTNWVFTGVMEVTNGIWRFADGGTTNFNRRYYRARQLP